MRSALRPDPNLIELTKKCKLIMKVYSTDETRRVAHRSSDRIVTVDRVAEVVDPFNLYGLTVDVDPCLLRLSERMNRGDVIPLSLFE